MSKSIQEVATAVRERVNEIEKDYIGKPWLEAAEAVSPIIEEVLGVRSGIEYDFIMEDIIGQEKTLRIILFKKREKNNAILV